MSELQFLFLEDNPLDAEVVRVTLKEGGIDCQLRQVETRDQFIAALKSDRFLMQSLMGETPKTALHRFDLILADYALPSFDGLTALEIALDLCPDIPFILVSGSMGEELAIDSLKQGATDYVLKQRLERLVPCVRRALKEAQKRREYEQTARALKESEAQFRSFAEHSNDVIWITEAQEYRLIYVSPAYEKLWGRSSEEIHADLNNFLTYVYPEDRDCLREAWQHCTQGGFIQEYRILRPDGAIIWIRDRGFPIYDDLGNLLWLGGIAEDITERKQAEAALAADLKATQLLRDLSVRLTTEENIQVLYNEIVNAAIALTGADAGSVQILEEGTQDLLLLATQGSTSKMVEHFYRVNVSSNTPCGIALARGERTFIDFDVPENEDPNGSLRMHVEAGYLSAQSTPLISRSGKPIGMFSTHWRKHHRPSERELRFLDLLARQAADLIEQQQIKTELRESEALFQKAFSIETVGVLFFSLDGRITGANKAFVQMSGYSHDELVDTVHWKELTPCEFVDVTTRAAGELADRGETAPYEKQMLRKDGSRWWGLFAPTRLTNSGSESECVEFIIDISDRKQGAIEREKLLAREQAARAEAEEANRVKDEFLAIVSHELRTPLNPILGWIMLLQTQKLNPTKTTQAFDIIERNAKLQAELIEDLLDMSRILRGKLNLNVTKVNLVSTIRSAMETVRLSAESKSIQIHTNFEPDISVVLGDTSRLQQVFWNLLSNAIKFTPEGGRVDICLEKLDSTARISVSDTGKGIAPEFLPSVFQYFTQESKVTTRRYGGLGLGLAIVRHLVELHGGTIEVDSPGEGQGTTFTLTFPLKNSSSPTPDNHPSNEPALDLEGIEILVVDDHRDTLNLVTFILEQYGAKAIAVSCALEALKVLTDSPPDILLSDIGLPEVDGYMLMRQIRDLPPERGGQIPAIALTAFAGELDYQQAISAGFQRHISKPVEPAKLVKTIASLASRPGKLIVDQTNLNLQSL